MVASYFVDVSSLSCLIAWLEITATRETSAVIVNDIASQIAKYVGAVVEATNSLPANARTVTFHNNRKSQKWRRLIEPISVDSLALTESKMSNGSGGAKIQGVIAKEERKKQAGEDVGVSAETDDMACLLSRMIAVPCEQRLFLPLLRAFEIFLPSCSLLPFVRALQVG
ncbi:hypothetical protein Fot_03128 [Forsythia ovata]|uniref:Uncharacterized protein n=1 Tax=Forsythia ovata TaxID=205694 RepID=A0ABD1X8U6_9LAMI